ncbi:troponin C, isoallergen Bla g 6.0101 [Halyomorpha halys]|uniref:troponin C, isoallergen Bla g 6.0101 n=1 Tax=Halyomorpha halys TaxID=286706 RepID=UPI0006D4EE7F|nr:troponin C-like [Halyomorpha halys]
MSVTLSKSQVNLLKKAFGAFEIEGKNTIPTNELSTILEMMGIRQTQETINTLIREFDPWGSGEIDFDSFSELSSRYMAEEENPEQMQQELREAFRLYDKEGNGYITTEVMREILAELDDTIPDYELDQMIDEIDADGSGTVDFEEFMEVMTGGDD